MTDRPTTNHDPDAPQPATLFNDQAATPADGGDDAIRKAWNATLCVLCLAALGWSGWLLYCLRADGQLHVARASARIVHVEPPPRREVAFPPIVFADITASARLTYNHDNGAAGELLMPENFTGGCAFLDYDNDGDADIAFVNARRITPPAPGEAPAKPPRAALFRNDGQGSFTDVTDETGLDVTMFGMGIAVADYDADGACDIFFSGLGEHRLLRNEGGRFRDVTEQAGVRSPADRWTTSCGFLDYDRDGDLDLFVCNYVSWSRELDLSLDHRFAGEATYLPPAMFKGGFCILYRNRGDGTFEDVSETAGIRVLNPLLGMPAAKALGCVFCDVDKDGWIDIFVANDLVPSFLFHNQGNGTFLEVGTRAGLAFGHNGTAVSGMGVDVIRGDRGVLLGMANIARDPTAMFRSQRDALTYLDETRQAGVYADSLLVTTWGLFFFDVDLDGRLDMFQCNGSTNTEKGAAIEGIAYRQPVQLFWNSGGSGGPPFVLFPPERMTRNGPLPDLQARGAAYADIDGDGDLDILIAQLYGSPVLLRNDQQTGHHWLRFRLQGKGGNRDAIGAWVYVTQDGKRQSRQVMPTCSYLSQVEREVTFGLGKSRQVEKVEIEWPDGTRQEVAEFHVDALNVIAQP